VNLSVISGVWRLKKNLSDITMSLWLAESLRSGAVTELERNVASLQEIRSWAFNASPIFICGLERSGTSMLQVALSRHANLFPVKDVYETFAFVKPAALLENPPPTMALAYMNGPERAQQFRQLCTQLATGPAGLSEADLIRTYFHFCAHVVYPGRRPLEKTPGHVRKLKRMMELFPQARVIVCTRDPVAVVGSYQKRLAKEKALGKPRSEWEWLDRTVDQLLAHFQAVSEHVVAAKQRWPGSIFVAPYDWITDQPEAAIRQLAAFCQLEFSASMLAPPEVQGRKVDELLSRPISRRDDDTGGLVDEATAQRIRDFMQPWGSLWNTAGNGQAPIGPR
jgi:hypothetical protein